MNNETYGNNLRSRVISSSESNLVESLTLVIEVVELVLVVLPLSDIFFLWISKLISFIKLCCKI